MAEPVKRSRYFTQEVVLILGWAYVVAVAGGITALISFRVQAVDAGLAAAILGLWLSVRLLQRRRIRFAGFEAGLVLFLGALVVATAYSQDVRRSLGALALYITYGLAFYLWLDLLRSGWPAELIEKALVIVGAGVVGLGLFDTAAKYLQWRALTLNGALPFGPPFVFRLYTLLGDANLGAAVINLTILLALARGLWQRGRTRWAWWAYALVALVFAYFTSSRGGWLGLGVGVLTLAAWELGRLDRARLLAAGRLRLDELRRQPLISTAAVLILVAAVGLAAFLIVRQSAGPTHGPIASARSSFWRAAMLAFQSSPLTGTGPGTYPSQFTRFIGVPPERPYLHAHSVPFTLLAETGLNGMVGLVVLLASAAPIALRKIRLERAREQNDKTYQPFAGPLAGLAGLAVHSLFDNHLPFPSVGIAAAFLLAVLFARLPEPPPGAAKLPLKFRRPGISAWLFIGLGLPVVLLTAYSLRAASLAHLGVEAAGKGSWPEAADRFDEAARLDPALALYQFQAGYAHGRLAAADAGSDLTVAIEHYERGLAIEGDYSLNHANLGALYLQAGRPAEAQVEMRRAIALSGGGGWWLYLLNYGVVAEDMGQADTAAEYYTRALEARASIAEAEFWRQSDLRRQILAVWLAETGGPGSPDALAQGWIALADADLPAAQAAFERAWREDPLRAGVYHGLAEVARGRGDEARAESYLASALSLQTAENESKVLPLLTWAELSARQGKVELARSQYQSVYDALAKATVYGWGTAGFSPYPWFVYNREGAPVDLLSQLMRADVSPAMAARLLPLGEMLEAAGDMPGAIKVYRGLLTFDPTLAQASARLAALDAR